MTKELSKYVNDYESMTAREKTNGFNGLSIDDRREFYKSLFEEDKELFKAVVRNRAVADFWTHERELIEDGQCTRDWTPDQIESIMHISEKTGNKKLEGGVPEVIKPNH